MTGIMSVFGDLMSGMNTIVSVVTANEILQIGIAAAVGGIAISWYMRLTHQKSGKKR